jgi:hypothetical protein
VCAQEEAGGSDDEAAYDREVVRAHVLTQAHWRRHLSFVAVAC